MYRQGVADSGYVKFLSPDRVKLILQARFFKDRWFMLDLPRHLHQFEPKNLELKLAGLGLKVLKKDKLVNPAGTFISLKKSLLRYGGLKRAPVKNGAQGTHRRIAGLRLGFDSVCIMAALLLVLFRREDSFRVYCKKAVTTGSS